MYCVCMYVCNCSQHFGMMGFVKEKRLDLVLPVVTAWQSWMFASLFVLDKKINEVRRSSCHKL